MKEAPIPDNEKDRLAALHAYQVLDTDEERAFDELTELAATICQKPIALVSLIDGERQWFKSHHGLEARETPRKIAFCAHAILEDEVFEVRNSLEDERFHDNPLVTDDPRVTFYAGAQLVNSEGHKLGTMCVIDSEPGGLSEEQKRSLKAIANQVVMNLEYRKSLIELKFKNDQMKTMYDKLESTNEEISQFAHITSHDLKGPLESIRSFCQVILEDLNDKEYEEVESNVKRIGNMSKDLSTLVSDILNLARADLEIAPMRRVNLRSVISEAIAYIDPLAKENGVEIKVSCECDSFLGQKTRFFQVLINLLSNGVKYSNPEREDRFISVIASRTDDMLKMRIEDNGLGIPKQFHKDLFAPFTRFHTNAASGSGLGMRIVKKHIESMNGTVALSSSKNGTRFEIDIPIGRRTKK